MKKMATVTSHHYLQMRKKCEDYTAEVTLEYAEVR